MDCVSRSKVREAILSMDTPFCLSDLVSRMKDKGIEDVALVMQVLNTVYDEGLVDYGRVLGENHVTGCSEWAFSVI